MNNETRVIEQPFVIVHDYLCEGDFQFGVWDAEQCLYMFADGDGYTPEYVRDQMPNKTYYTQFQIEVILKSAYAAVLAIPKSWREQCPSASEQ